MSDEQKDGVPAPAHKARMAVPPDAPPGIEQDEKGNLIPFDERTCDDQEKARNGH